MRLRVVNRKTGVGGHFLVKFARQGGHDEIPLPSHRFQPGTSPPISNVLPTFIHSFILHIFPISLSLSLSVSRGSTYPWPIFTTILTSLHHSLSITQSHYHIPIINLSLCYQVMSWGRYLPTCICQPLYLTSEEVGSCTGKGSLSYHSVVAVNIMFPEEEKKEGRKEQTTLHVG